MRSLLSAVLALVLLAVVTSPPKGDRSDTPISAETSLHAGSTASDAAFIKPPTPTPTAVERMTDDSASAPELHGATAAFYRVPTSEPATDALERHSRLSLLQVYRL